MDFVISSCLLAGAFDPQKVRGIGAFLDRGRVVLNAGDRLILDGGEERPIRAQGRDLRCLYSRGGAATQGLKLSVQTPPISTQEAEELAGIIGSLGWGSTEHGTYLYGWLVAAVISGALAWRPHVWITGAAGSGKSWVLDNIIKPCFDDFAIAATGNTSEAALRNLANDDSRPIIYDEAEVKTSAERQNIQNILALARASSTIGGASVSKSMSGGGGVVEYRVRSCFLFSSITTGLHSAADAGRFLNLNLRQNALTAAQFKEVVRRSSVLTHRTGFGARFIMRAFQRARYINAAIQPFADYVEEICGDKRLADTNATVLAAAYMYGSDVTTAPTPSEIAEWMEGNGFSADSFLRRTYESDDTDILGIISGKIVRWDNRDFTVAEAINAVVQDNSDGVNLTDATRWLRRHGIKLEVAEAYRDKSKVSLTSEHYTVYIAKNPNLARLFMGTSYESAWFETLLQHPMAFRGRGAKRMGVGAAKRQWLFMPARCIVGSPDALASPTDFF